MRWKDLHPKTIQVQLMLIVGGLIFIFGLILVLVGHQSMRQQALLEARDKAQIILDRNLATHTYFSKKLKTSLFASSQAFRDDEYFDPTWMSSTYAIRHIEKYFRQINNEGYIYSEEALNPKNPENTADAISREFLEDLSDHNDLKRRSLIRWIDGEPYLEVMRRGEIFEEKCLRCHGSPKNVPSGVLVLYGDKAGNNKTPGDVASVLSVRVPLSDAFDHADRLAGGVFACLVLLTIVINLIVYYLTQKFVFSPLNTIRNKAARLASGDYINGESIPLPKGEELQCLTLSFNSMMNTIKNHIYKLENIVSVRTQRLQKANQELHEEVEHRKAIEKELIREKFELEHAIEKIEVLSGLLPICAQCKKIRDDQGYWSQIELYISKYSQAEFTHSICPECAEKLYPEYYEKSSS